MSGRVKVVDVSDLVAGSLNLNICEEQVDDTRVFACSLDLVHGCPWM